MTETDIPHKSDLCFSFVQLNNLHFRRFSTTLIILTPAFLESPTMHVFYKNLPYFPFFCPKHGTAISMTRLSLGEFASHQTERKACLCFKFERFHSFFLFAGMLESLLRSCTDSFPSDGARISCMHQWAFQLVGVWLLSFSPLIIWLKSAVSE